MSACNILITSLSSSSCLAMSFHEGRVCAFQVYHLKELPERTFRHAKKYEIRKSPLMELEWWRVALDEAQFACGHSAAAKVAKLLNGQHKWAITGIVSCTHVFWRNSKTRWF